jgi:DNA topoisomerase-3
MVTQFEIISILSYSIQAIAEKLYQQGYISYPRTETEVFEQGIDLRSLIE